jgi:putative transposase
VILLECWLEFHRSQECPHVKGKSIGEVFNEDRGNGVDIAGLDDLMMDMKITNIGRNGIRFLNQHYYDDNLYNLREQVIIRYSLFDLSHIKVYSMSGEHIGTAERVMPVHPLANVLGTPNDVEHLKQQISMQKRAEKKTIQGSKELMRLGKTVELDWQKVIEVSPKIVDRLESPLKIPHYQGGIEGGVSAIEESIPEECVQGTVPDHPLIPPFVRGDIGGCCVVESGLSPSPTDVIRLEPQGRPIFESNIDRYEWHLKYGVFTDEDEAWCVWFRTTDEFRMLYSAFQNQAHEAEA